jgi:hypothetical protein
MFTTGSKLLIGSAVLTTVATLVYIVTENESLGVVGLASAALALAFLAGVNMWAHDSNLSAMDAVAVATSEASDDPPGASIWPMVFAIGGVTIAVGLVTQQTVFTIGLVIVLAAGAQWTVQAWAERASADGEINAAVRNRLANPLEYPLAGAIAVGGIAFAFSRVMLWLSKTNTVVAFAVLATVVACVAFFIAVRPTVKRGAIGGVLAVGAIAIVAGGAAASVDGERDIHEHEVISSASRVVCDSPEEFEVDENASQTVAGKSSTWTVRLTESGELTYDVPGPVADPSQIEFPRSNSNNIIFRNDSGESRRLTADLGPLTADEIQVESEADTHSGVSEGEELSNQRLVCTTLIEEGGSQLLTLKIDIPSGAVEGGYVFYVPGTDAELKVVVP